MCYTTFSLSGVPMTTAIVMAYSNQSHFVFTVKWWDIPNLMRPKAYYGRRRRILACAKTTGGWQVPTLKSSAAGSANACLRIQGY